MVSGPNDVRRSPASAALLGLIVLAWCAEIGTAPAAGPSGSAPPGDPEAGRAVFNGSGICYYCHGRDGDPALRPDLSPQTADIIAHLNPPPPDLRRTGQLRLKNDAQRFRIIREGHLGTGMLPDPSLSDREIRDLLAYLAELRKEGPEAGTPAR
ncbi:c-type cytochrome [Candidatus Nitrospira bockiana]